jgi:uncharacterized UBP type Zn finger protein
MTSDASANPACQHAPAASAAPNSDQCEGCGSRFNLRLCLHCGHVGCCESQAGHARAHALSAEHPVISQLTGSDATGFSWCYVEGSYVG